MSAESVEIDDALYSRQRYVLGDTAMQKMAKSHVFLSGMGGLGLEIAKNLVLAGIKALTIHDTEKCQAWDLGTNFFLCEDDVINMKNRAEAVLQHIAELNPYVHVTSSSVPFNETTDLSFLDKYQCVVLTEMKLPCRRRSMTSAILTALQLSSSVRIYMEFGHACFVILVMNLKFQIQQEKNQKKFSFQT